MSEERPRIGPDPLGLWSQWYDANSRALSGMLGGDAEALMDPFGLYRQWSGGLQGGSPEEAPPDEFLGQWVEATSDVWRRYAEYVSLLAGFTPLWARMAQDVPRKMYEEGIPTDPLDFYTRLYEATNGPLSEMIREVLQNETFLADARRFSENRASLEAVLGEASERYFGDNLRLSTRSDNTRVARLVVGMEDKLDRLEEAFEEFEYGHAKPATAENVGALEERIGGLEKQLGDNRSDLARVEEKLDRLFAALDTAANGDAQTAGDAAEKGEG